MAERKEKQPVTICLPGVKPVKGFLFSESTDSDHKRRAVVVAPDGAYNVSRKRVCPGHGTKDEEQGL